MNTHDYTYIRKLLSALLCFMCASYGAGNAFSATPSSPADSAVLKLSPGVAIVVTAGESAPVRRAVRDLQRDLKNVLGAESPVVAAPPANTNTPFIVVTTGTNTAGAAWRDDTLIGVEAHQLRAQKNAIVLQGADMRGTIYAIYEFSDRFLGIPPLWYWLQYKPAKKDTVEIPTALSLRFGPASIRYRTWYPNDNDMIDPWLNESKEHYEAMFEALLRSKFNVLDVSYVSDIPKPNQGLIWARTCRERGIIVTSTHTATFGVRWVPAWEPYWRLVRKQEPPPLMLSSEKYFWEFWRYFIELSRREGYEMLWQIVFRGDFDKKMTLTFPDAPTEAKDLAPLVERMLRSEVEFLRKVTGDPNPPMRAVLYDEAAQYYEQGMINLPEAPSLVWTFGNDKTAMIPYKGCLTRRFPEGQKIGYYYNLQYTAVGSHLVEAQSPKKLYQVLTLMRDHVGAPLGELQINIGNLRDFPLGTSAATELAWNFDSFDPAAFVHEYCARYFRAQHATEAADIYDALFTSYWEVRAPESYAPIPRQYLFTDLKTARYSEAVLYLLCNNLYDGSPIKNIYWLGSVDPQYVGTNDQLSAILAGNAQMLPRLEALKVRCEKLAASLEPKERAIFETSVSSLVAFQLYSNRMLGSLIEAARAQSTGDRAAMKTHLDAASLAAHAAVSALKDSDRGEFARWHERAGPHGYRARDFADEIDRLRSLAPGKSAAPGVFQTH